MALGFSSSKKEEAVTTKQCPEFVEGDKCQFETRYKYYGAYEGTMTNINTGDDDLYSISVSTGDENFNTLKGYQSFWSFDKDGNISIAKQKRESISSGIEGTGKFKGDSLILNLKHYYEQTDLVPDKELIYKGKRN